MVSLCLWTFTWSLLFPSFFRGQILIYSSRYSPVVVPWFGNIYLCGLSLGYILCTFPATWLWQHNPHDTVLILLNYLSMGIVRVDYLFFFMFLEHGGDTGPSPYTITNKNKSYVVYWMDKWTISSILSCPFFFPIFFPSFFLSTFLFTSLPTYPLP